MMNNREQQRSKAHTFSNVIRIAIVSGSAILFVGAPSRATIASSRPAPEIVKAEVPPIKWLVKMGGHVEVNLENPHTVFEVGRQLPLFQQSGENYIAIVTTYDGETRLCAFPRFVGNESSAWMSNDNLLIFGRRTESTSGKFSFERDETLPLLREDPDTYTITVERLGRSVALSVSKKEPGVILVPLSQSSVASSETRPAAESKLQPFMQLDSAADAQPAAPFSAQPAASAVETSPELALAKIREEVLQELMDRWEEAKKKHGPAAATIPKELSLALQSESAKSGPVGAASTEPALSIEQANSDAVAVSDAKMAPAASLASASTATLPDTTRIQTLETAGRTWPQEAAGNNYLHSLLTSFIHDNAVTLILTGLMLPLGIVVAVRWRTHHASGTNVNPGGRRASDKQHTTSTEVFTYSTVGESVAPDNTTSRFDERGDLSGTLGGHILPQVVQFFCTSHESGRMIIHQDSGLSEELVFKDGQIIDAQTGNVRGEDAARLILQQRDGSFVFHRGNPGFDKPSIKQDTMALLLDTHRHIDEMRSAQHA
jgi:hypothetical protein